MSLEPIVQELVDKLNAEPEMKQAMQDSFTLAYSTGLEEFAEYNIHNLDEYIRFMNDYVRWIPTENSTGTNVYNHLCMFYFIIDMPPINQWQNPILPDQKSPWMWLSDWLIRYAQDMGNWMKTPESITPESIKTFYNAPNYHMQDYPVPSGGWTSFNDFFARNIDPAVRPIDSPTDDTVIVNPADCVFDGTWPVRDPEADVNTFDVKGIPWTINQLLDDFELGETFKGGIFTHSFLNTNDYHRQHAPVSGRVIQAKVIPGICYLEVILQETTSKQRKSGFKLGMHRYLRRKDDKHLPTRDRAARASATPSADLDAPDRPGYQFLQARGLILIDNPKLGLVAVLPIGMAQVSSVVLSVRAGDYVNKGDEISCFHLGGSDIVMVFQKDANVKFEQTVGEHYNFGMRAATGGT
jgi:phosphatidylserine decarboxylase